MISQVGATIAGYSEVSTTNTMSSKSLRSLTNTPELVSDDIAVNPAMSAGVNQAQLQCNLTGDSVYDQPTMIGGCPHYLTTPIMTQNDKAWDLPFEEYSLM